MQISVSYIIPEHREEMVERFYDEGDWSGLREVLDELRFEMVSLDE